jgi:hypothetical protein
MPKKKTPKARTKKPAKKRPARVREDVNQAAFRVVREATEDR